MSTGVTAKDLLMAELLKEWIVVLGDGLDDTSDASEASNETMLKALVELLDASKDPGKRDQLGEMGSTDSEISGSLLASLINTLNAYSDNNEKICVKILQVLANLGQLPSNRISMMHAQLKLLPSLVAILMQESDDQPKEKEKMKLHCLELLNVLALEENNKVSIVKTEWLLSSLVNILREEGHSLSYKNKALFILGTLSLSVDTRTAMLKLPVNLLDELFNSIKHGIEAIDDTNKTESLEGLANALWTVRSLSLSRKTCVTVISKNTYIPILMKCAGESTKIDEHIISLFGCLVEAEEKNVDALIQYGALEFLMNHVISSGIVLKKWKVLAKRSLQVILNCARVKSAATLFTSSKMYHTNITSLLGNDKNSKSSSEYQNSLLLHVLLTEENDNSTGGIDNSYIPIGKKYPAVISKIVSGLVNAIGAMNMSDESPMVPKKDHVSYKIYLCAIRNYVLQSDYNKTLLAQSSKELCLCIEGFLGLFINKCKDKPRNKVHNSAADEVIINGDKRECDGSDLETILLILSHLSLQYTDCSLFKSAVYTENNNNNDNDNDKKDQYKISSLLGEINHLSDDVFGNWGFDRICLHHALILKERYNTSKKSDETKDMESLTPTNAEKTCPLVFTSELASERIATMPTILLELTLEACEKESISLIRHSKSHEMEASGEYLSIDLRGTNAHLIVILGEGKEDKECILERMVVEDYLLLDPAPSNKVIIITTSPKFAADKVLYGSSPWWWLKQLYTSTPNENIIEIFRESDADVGLNHMKELLGIEEAKQNGDDEMNSVRHGIKTIAESIIITNTLKSDALNTAQENKKEVKGCLDDLLISTERLVANDQMKKAIISSFISTMTSTVTYQLTNQILKEEQIAEEQKNKIQEEEKLRLLEVERHRIEAEGLAREMAHEQRHDVASSFVAAAIQDAERNEVIHELEVEKEAACETRPTEQIPILYEATPPSNPKPAQSDTLTYSARMTNVTGDEFPGSSSSVYSARPNGLLAPSRESSFDPLEYITHPRKVKDGIALATFLDNLGVTDGAELQFCEKQELESIAALLKPIPKKIFLENMMHLDNFE